MKLKALYEDANFALADAIPVSKAEFQERASGVNTPPAPCNPQPNSDKSGNQYSMGVGVARPTAGLHDQNPGLTQSRASQFFNTGPANAAPESGAAMGGKSTIGQQPKILAKRDDPVTP